MKNKTAGLLMEVGVEYDKKRLHGKKYFENLLGKLDDLPDSIHLLLNISRNNLELFQGVQKRLLSLLRDNPMVRDRVGLLMTIPGVGQVTALTWVLEIGDPRRFNRISEVISYCGLCSAQKESGGKSHRGPISKKRNKHIQSVLIEAAKPAPRFNEDLALVHAKESCKGHRNRATLAVARKLATYILAVDKSGTAFVSGLKRAAA
jgi:transposase